MSGPRRKNQITWGPTAEPAREPKARRTTCNRCLVGDCHLCVRAGCNHPCPNMRKPGVPVPASSPYRDGRPDAATTED